MQPSHEFDVTAQQTEYLKTTILAAVLESEERIRADIASLSTTFAKKATALDEDVDCTILTCSGALQTAASNGRRTGIASPPDVGPSRWQARSPSMLVADGNGCMKESPVEACNRIYTQSTASGSAAVTGTPAQQLKPSSTLKVMEEIGATASFAKQGSTLTLQGVDGFGMARSQGLAHMQSNATDIAGGNATAHFWHSWPSNVPLLAEYAECASPDLNSELLTAVAEHVAGRSFVALPTITGESLFDGTYQTKVVSMMMIRPDSARRLLYDGLSMMVLTLDLIFTPFYLAWGSTVPDRVAIPILAFSMSFWLLDLCLCFFTGCYTKEGLVELRFIKVAVNYLKTWFFLDFTCVAADIANVMPVIINGSRSTTQAVSRFIRVIKLVRFLRVLGMLRMVRLVHAINMFMEAELSETWRMLIRMVQITAGLIGLVHWCACAWYILGTDGPSGVIGESWIDMPLGLIKEHEIASLGAWYQYTLCYQWGLAQISLGAHDIIPINSWERVFTTACNLFGLLFGGTLISILSATLIDMKEINQERASKMQVLREYLLQHNVEIGVRLRVLSQLRERVKQRDRVLVEKDVKALEVLSQALLRDLRECIFAQSLLTHDIFRAWNSLDDEILKHMYAEKELNQLFLLPDDELFASSEVATAGYYVISGHLEYNLESQLLLAGGADVAVAQLGEDASVLSAEAPSKDEDEVSQVHADQWLSEATWWCLWCHVGTATSRLPCTLMSVSPKAVLTVMSQNLTVHAITAMYARLFHQQLVQAWHRYFELPTDIHVHHSQLGDLIVSMPKEVSIVLGRASLQHAVSRYRLRLPFQSSAGLMHLEEEIREARSVVLLDRDWSLQRHVALTLARLVRAPGPVVLAELGYFDPGKGEWLVSCRLPGTKQKTQESPLETLQRYLEIELGCGSQWQQETNEGRSFTTTREVAASARFGVGTTYNKSVFTIPATSSILSHLAASKHRIDGAGLCREISMHSPPSPLGTYEVAMEPVSTLGFEGKDGAARNLLMDIVEVYVLGGSERVGIYAWIDEKAMESLARQKASLSKWIASVSQLVQC